VINLGLRLVIQVALAGIAGSDLRFDFSIFQVVLSCNL